MPPGPLHTRVGDPARVSTFYPRTSKPLGNLRNNARGFHGPRYLGRGPPTHKLWMPGPFGLGMAGGLGWTKSKGGALGVGKNLGVGWHTARFWAETPDRVGSSRDGGAGMAEARGAGWARPVCAMGGVCKGSCRVAALSGRGGRGRGSSFYSAGAGRVQRQKPLRPAPSRRCCVFPTLDWASGAMLYLFLRGCRWLGRSFTCLSAYRGPQGSAGRAGARKTVQIVPSTLRPRWSFPRGEGLTGLR